MKIGYIGGGSLRIIQEVRALAREVPQIMDSCELALFDFDGQRVQAMALILGKIPELKKSNYRITVESSMDKTVEGSDFSGWKIPDIPVPEKLDGNSRKTALEQKDPIQRLCYCNPNHSDTQVERCIQACPLC